MGAVAPLGSEEGNDTSRDFPAAPPARAGARAHRTWGDRMRKPFRPATLALGLALASGPSVSKAETLKQDFNSLEDLKAFWDISAWANENRSHSAQNVSVAGGILTLKLSASPPGTKPVCAEVVSKRADFRYGSYRASLRTSRVAGGVVGWFVYRDSPLNEIDVEMLTKDNRDLHFTLHHIQAGVDYKLVKLAFDPSAGFHEYRFDWHPGSVDYFVDGKPAGSLAKQVPDQDAAMMLNHWSGNLAGWGGPAPLEDMYMDVDWVAYSSEFPAALALPPKPGARAAPILFGNAATPLLTLVAEGGSPRLRAFDPSGRSRQLLTARP
jgi:endo-1,3-1,4-beta-glycanase ExoK